MGLQKNHATFLSNNPKLYVVCVRRKKIPWLLMPKEIFYAEFISCQKTKLLTTLGLKKVFGSTEKNLIGTILEWHKGHFIKKFDFSHDFFFILLY